MTTTYDLDADAGQKDAIAIIEELCEALEANIDGRTCLDDCEIANIGVDEIDQDWCTTCTDRRIYRNARQFVSEWAMRS